MKKKCGPYADDEYDYYSESVSGIKSRRHIVSGYGIITKNNACDKTYGKNYYEDSYIISDGISELGDNCFSNGGVVFVSLPNTLVKIGSSCFKKSRISLISIPESVTEIGHENFPPTLTTINIPANLKSFPADNLFKCKALTTINVAENNRQYKIIDGILYNYDISIALVCPRGKSGKIIIPDTVNCIAEKCFQDCKKITAIELPRSIVSIGAYAFSGLDLDCLILPNSITSIGEGCFSCIKINKKFKFSHRISELPDNCFKEASLPSIDFLKDIRIIGRRCFDTIEVEYPQEYLYLPRVEHIGEYAFCGLSKTSIIEILSTLSFIGENAFSLTADNLKVIYLSFVPIKIPVAAFQEIGPNATLYIPTGSKIIFKNTPPWSAFTNIKEIDPINDIVDERKEVSDEHHLSRLISIANSVGMVDRVFLKGILEEISLDYNNVDNEVAYHEAMNLIEYNLKFNPPLYPGLEKDVCADWQYRYKLKCVSKQLLDRFSKTIEMLQPSSVLEYQNSKTLPELVESSNNKPSLLSEQIGNNVEIYFSDILRYLQNEISVAGNNIKIAVSWFTNYALFKQIIDLAKKGIEIHIIVNNDSINNGGYCLDFNELIKVGVHLSLVEYPHLIHHKFCIIDDKTVINGSYNWTRFSEKNYENIMIFKNNDFVTRAFNDEFDTMLQVAEHKNIVEMPKTVPLRPEYDRGAFRQYVTEELDAEAKERTEHRSKIEILHKAANLNPEFFKELNPKANESLSEAFKVIEQSDDIEQAVISMAQEETLLANDTGTDAVSQTAKIHRNYAVPKNNKVTSDDKARIIEQIKASEIFMVIDVSASMKQSYESGAVYNITKQAISASLKLTNTRHVSLWEFGDSSRFVNEISIENLGDINDLKCKSSGTKLNTFVACAGSSISSGSLVIIFTDDDEKSICGAIREMRDRVDVFWQIIVCGKHTNLSSAIGETGNVSLVSLKENSEINRVLLADYINWKGKHSHHPVD